MDLQEQCETGQRALMQMRYLDAEAALVEAERVALERGVWETLARLYMPLQEARRQRRQLCGEGTIALDLVPTSADDVADAARVAEDVPQGQVLLAGWGSIEPALRLRGLARKRQLYLETFLAAAYPMGDGVAVAIVPTADVDLPPLETATSPDALLANLPPHSLLLNADELPKGRREGTTATFAETMALWERLHRPFLAAAKATPDPRRRIDAYRRAIAVDYACEKAHQWLSDTAGEMERGQRGKRGKQ